MSFILLVRHPHNTALMSKPCCEPSNRMLIVHGFKDDSKRTLESGKFDHDTSYAMLRLLVTSQFYMVEKYGASREIRLFHFTSI